MTPELHAILRALTAEQLHHLRLYAIPAELRKRVAGERAAAWEWHEKDYEAQGRPAK